MTNSYDVAIIGAGPAGCACPLALQGSGLQVVLIESAVVGKGFENLGF